MKQSIGEWTQLRIPRRRVPAELLLADGIVSYGELYVDVVRPDGSTGRVADRLADAQERYLPLACENQHVIVSKAAIVMVRLSREEVQFPTMDRVRQHQVLVRLSTGTTVEGTFCAFAVQGYTRVMDYLNRSADRFVPLLEGDSAVLINSSYISAVTEVRQHESIGV